MSCDNSKNSFKQMLYFWIQYDTLLIFWQCIFSGFEVGTLCKALSISQFGSAPAAVSGMVGPSVCLERREKPVTPSNPWGQHHHHRQLLTILYHRLTASAPAQLCPTMFSTGTEKSFQHKPHHLDSPEKIFLYLRGGIVWRIRIHPGPCQWQSWEWPLLM